MRDVKPDNLLDSLEHTYPVIFPNIYKILLILITMPVSAASGFNFLITYIFGACYVTVNSSFFAIAPNPDGTQETVCSNYSIAVMLVWRI